MGLEFGKNRQATYDNIIRRMHFAYWITKATDTLWEYVILIAYPRQKWLWERALMLDLYVHCLSCLQAKGHRRYTHTHTHTHTHRCRHIHSIIRTEGWVLWNAARRPWHWMSNRRHCVCASAVWFVTSAEMPCKWINQMPYCLPSHITLIQLLCPICLPSNVKIRQTNFTLYYIKRTPKKTNADVVIVLRDVSALRTCRFLPKKQHDLHWLGKSRSPVAILD
jgi:hypothetical protein